MTVNWSINGTAQTPIKVLSPMDTIGGSGVNTAPVFLGNLNFAGGQLYRLRIWTSNPNGIADTINTNDTLTRVVTASLQGTYTINAGMPAGGVNMVSFTQAAFLLNTYGVCGPTYIVVVPNSGPYLSRIVFQEIAGASAINTITIDGGPTKEEIWVDGALTASGNRHVIRLNGTDHMTLKNLRISNHAASGTGTQYGVGIHVRNEADSNIIENCIIEVDSAEQQTNANFNGIQFAGRNGTSSNASGSGNIIRNNKIHGGYYGITMRGSSSSNYQENNLIENNEFTGQWYYNIYAYYQRGLIARNNYMAHRRPANTFG